MKLDLKNVSLYINNTLNRATYYGVPTIESIVPSWVTKEVRAVLKLKELCLKDFSMNQLVREEIRNINGK
jgi:hypothetical protein